MLVLGVTQTWSISYFLHIIAPWRNKRVFSHAVVSLYEHKIQFQILNFDFLWEWHPLAWRMSEWSESRLLCWRESRVARVLHCHGHVSREQATCQWDSMWCHAPPPPPPIITQRLECPRWSGPARTLRHVSTNINIKVHKQKILSKILLVQHKNDFLLNFLHNFILLGTVFQKL